MKRRIVIKIKGSVEAEPNIMPGFSFFCGKIGTQKMKGFEIRTYHST